jgi:hypothetical protein
VIRYRKVPRPPPYESAEIKKQCLRPRYHCQAGGFHYIFIAVRYMIMSNCVAEELLINLAQFCLQQIWQLIYNVGRRQFLSVN